MTHRGHMTYLIICYYYGQVTRSIYLSRRKTRMSQQYSVYCHVKMLRKLRISFLKPNIDKIQIFHIRVSYIHLNVSIRTWRYNVYF